MTCLGLVHSDDVASAVLSRLNSIENNAFAFKLCIGVTDIVSARTADELALKSYVLLKAEPYGIGVTPCACVRIERISEMMHSEITHRIGTDRSSEQSDLHHIVVNIVAVLAVVDNTCAVAALGKVSPLVSAELKLRLVVAGVVMSRIFSRTVSDFTACISVSDINGELCFKHLFPLVPIDRCVKIESRLILFKDNILSNC